MNSAKALVTLRAKRTAVAQWVLDNDSEAKNEDGILMWHRAYWERLDDAVAYLEARVRRGSHVDAWGVTHLPHCHTHCCYCQA